MKTTSTSHPIALAAQADLLLLVAEMLRQVGVSGDQDPRERLCALRRRDVRELVAASELEPASRLIDVIWQALRSAKRLPLEQWRQQYSLLFEGATICPVNQASYVRRDKGKILGDLSGFIRAFGWQPRPATGERPDHIVPTLEFTAALLAMISQAPDEASAEITVAGLAQFTRDHASDWFPAFCNQLVESVEQLSQSLPREHNANYYAHVAAALAELWQSLRDYHDWPVDPQPTVAWAPEPEPDDPYECGAPDLVQLAPAAAKFS